MTAERKDIPEGYKWDIEAMYPDEGQWSRDAEEAGKEAESFTAFSGRLTESADQLLAALRARDSLWLKAERVYVYSRMRRDEDNRNEKYQAMNAAAQKLLADISAKTSFFLPELLSADRETVMSYVEEDGRLGMYSFFLEDLFREKDHVLSGKEEALLAKLSEVTDASGDIFTMLNNADMDFGEISDRNGEKTAMTHGNYVNILRGEDRTLRKNAYERMYGKFGSLINTIAANYGARVKADIAGAEIRGYEDARSAALFPDDVPSPVYDGLISAVHDELPTLHRYEELKKQALGLDDYAMYDVYAPVVRSGYGEIPYPKAVEIINEALAPMGEEYLARLNEGFRSGWADVMENTGKTSGAYSFGSYDSKPYVLLNYTDTLDDVFTVIHEMGHSMHSSYTRESQPYIYGDHSIFTAEVASTVNENLLMKHLIAKETDPKEKAALIEKHIEDFRATVFRQTMFAEFEDTAHKEMAENGSLTAAGLCGIYDRLNTMYFGPAVRHDELIKYEWARIPHFYTPFYVYKYATGYSAASAISDLIIGNGPDDYIRFLRSGSSGHPVDLLRIAGVDMSTDVPVRNAMKEFRSLVDGFEKLITGKEAK